MIQQQDKDVIFHPQATLLVVRQIFVTAEKCWASHFLLFSLVASGMTEGNRGQSNTRILSLLLEEYEDQETWVSNIWKTAWVSVQFSLNMQYQIPMKVGQSLCASAYSEPFQKGKQP